MQIPVNLIVFTFLAAIIPALIVLVVAMLRIEVIRGDVTNAAHKCDKIKGDYDLFLAEYNNLILKITDAQTESHATSARVITLTETITALSNKWTSRERVEKINEKKREKEEKREEVIEEYSIPGTVQETLPFPLQSQLSQKPRYIPKRLLQQ